MSNAGVDNGRRRFLTVATTGVGAVGVGAVIWPFLASLNPSERAKALGAPVIADIGQLEPGQRLVMAWRGKPVWVVNRTPQMLENLPKMDAHLVDPQCEAPQQPDYIKAPARAIKPQYLVMTGVCTHLGCSPTFRPEHPAPDIDPNWLGGFHCPCHGSKFDLSGRVFKGVPAPTNMVVPPYRFDGQTTVVVGEDPPQA